MKRIARFLFIIILLTTVACHTTDPEPQIQVAYFEMDIEETYSTAASDDWVIVHNEDGLVLNVEFFESGDHIIFDSTQIPEKMGVTIVQVIRASRNFTINSYLNQKPLVKWTLKKEVQSEDQGSYVGSLNVTISDANLGSIYNSDISSFFNDGLAPVNNSLDIKFTERSAASKKKHFIFVTNKEGNPFYKILGTGHSGNYTYSLKDFTPFEKTITFNFPSSANYSVNVKGFEPGQNSSKNNGYSANLYRDGWYTGLPKSSVKLGFTDYFAQYRTSATIAYNGYFLGYSAFGSAATTNVTLVNDITAAVTNKTFINYAVSGSDYLWGTSTWSVGGSGDPYGLIGIYNSAEGGKSLQSIPVEITSKYPLLRAANFTYVGTVLYKGSQTYETFVAEECEGQIRAPYELKSKIFLN